MVDLKYYRMMFNVQRMSSAHKTRSYNLMEHSFMIGILFSHFCKKENIDYDVKVLELVYSHDVYEVITGDLIYPVKNFNEKTKEAWELIENELLKQYPAFSEYTDENFMKVMNEEQYKMFKVCDLLDLWIFLQEEKLYGNNSGEVQSIIEKCESLTLGKFKSVDEFINKYPQTLKECVR